MSNGSSRPRSSRGKKREEKRSFKKGGNSFRRGRQEKDVPSFRSEELEGIVRMSREGFAFIEVEGREDDIFIPKPRLRGALNGDTVKVVTTRGRGKGEGGGFRRIEGEVIHLIERSRKPHIGVLQVNVKRGEAWVIMESRVMPYDIFIPFNELRRHFSGDEIKNGVMNGQKAAVLVTGWPRRSPAPEGQILDILGEPGVNDTEMHSILAEFGLPYRFEPEVEADAEAIPAAITKKDIAERRDFRDITTFTIDPADAKDFDDALSFRELSDGRVEVGVHIADVTHYVKPGSKVDKCAYDRGTSVYLVDRTVPMLPEVLSNNLCSLRADEEKLCFSAVFEMDMKGRVYDRWLGRTIIRSNRRFNYNEVQEIIEGHDGDFSEEIRKLLSIAAALRKKRFDDGAISFERPEMKVEVDEQGRPVRVYEKTEMESNWLVEEFMLLANRAVAEFVGKVRGKSSGKTFVYRIHENPNDEKVAALRRFVNIFGMKMKETGSLAKSINDILDQAKGTPQQDAVVMMALRSMARASYTTENVGHYGLAFDWYTHFTSPIRRYPDMMVHRLLAMYLDGAKSQDRNYYEECCKYASQREQLATEAERSSIKYKLCEYMTERVGQEYDGEVSGITEWGMYVETLPEKVEGMIPLRTIKSDLFAFDEESYMIIGRRTGRKFTLGDRVRIRVIRSSVEQKLIDYELVENLD